MDPSVPPQEPTYSKVPSSFTNDDGQFKTFQLKMRLRPDSEDADAIAVPEDVSDLWEVWRFALTYNAYERHGNPLAVRAIGDEALDAWETSGGLPEDLNIARAALFCAQQDWRLTGWDPWGKQLEFFQALIHRIHRLSNGTVPGPGDPWP